MLTLIKYVFNNDCLYVYGSVNMKQNFISIMG